MKRIIVSFVLAFALTGTAQADTVEENAQRLTASNSQEKQSLIARYQAQVRCSTIARRKMSPRTNNLLEQALRTVDELKKRKIDPTPIYWRALSELDDARQQRNVKAMRKWMRECRIF